MVWRESAAEDKTRMSRAALRDFHVWSSATARSSLTFLSLSTLHFAFFRAVGTCFVFKILHRTKKNLEDTQVLISSCKLSIRGPVTTSTPKSPNEHSRFLRKSSRAASTLHRNIPDRCAAAAFAVIVFKGWLRDAMPLLRPTLPPPLRLARQT